MNSFDYFRQKFFMRILLLTVICFCLVNCGKNDSFDYTKVSIEIVFEDSISIRAIAPVDQNKVWFAANLGKVGLIDGKTPKLATIKYDDSLLHFRSIAKTENSVFVLSIGNPGVLYKIGYNDSSATHIEEVYLEEGSSVFYDSMKFWNDEEGIAIGDPTEDCLSIIITRDGGNTWNKLECSSLPKTVKGEAAFAASNSNIAIFGSNVWVVTGGAKARVFHSPDKGKHWEVYNTPIIQGGSMTGIYSVDFYDRSLGVIIGGNWEEKGYNEGNKAITKDGGKTWSLIANGSDPGYRSAIKFVPGSGGKGIVAVGSTGISFSMDQGKAWTKLSDEGFYSIEFVNDSLAFASGPNKISKLIFKK